jgi:hypothetical protein
MKRAPFGLPVAVLGRFGNDPREIPVGTGSSLTPTLFGKNLLGNFPGKV